jgi:hypothetical protein
MGSAVGVEHGVTNFALLGNPVLTVNPPQPVAQRSRRQRAQASSRQPQRALGFHGVS